MLALVFLGLLAIAASAEIERNGVIYDDYDQGIDSDESTEWKQTNDDVKTPDREKREAEMIPPSWLGAPYLHAQCRIEPSDGSTMQGYLYIYQKRPWTQVKVKGSLWGMIERRERFELGFHANALDAAKDCDSAGDTLMGALGVPGYLGDMKAKGSGRATRISRGNRHVTLEKGLPNSVMDRSIVVTSKVSGKRVGCCTLEQ